VKGFAAYRVHDEWLLTPHRLALHEPTRTAVIADLHLGYSAARRRAGDAVPAVSLDDELLPLKRACAELDLRSLVIAGDLCESRWDERTIDRFLAILSDCRLTLTAVTPGNHDRGHGDFGHRIPLTPDGALVGRWRVLHGETPGPRGPTVIGHLHPAWHSRPCFLVGPKRIVLPAFSADAAGGNVEGRSQWLGHLAIVIEGNRLVDRGPVVQRPKTTRPARRLGRGPRI
jgi:metallophosphoesterase superfamily enzyme